MHWISCSLIALALASGWEYCGHKLILHASPIQVKLWERYGVIGIAMREARFNHLMHHKLEASSAWTQERILLSARLSHRSIQQLEQTGFGSFVNPDIGSFALFSFIPLVASVPIYLFNAPQQLTIGLLIALLPYIATSWVHPYLHSDVDKINIPLPRLCANQIRVVLKRLQSYHLLHHQIPERNLNLVLGADQVIQLAGLTSVLIRFAPAKSEKSRASDH